MNSFLRKKSFKNETSSRLIFPSYKKPLPLRYHYSSPLFKEQKNKILGQSIWSQGEQSIQNEANNEEDTKDCIQLSGDGIGSFRDLFHKPFQEVNGFGEREEDEQTPGAQDSQDNHSDNVKINSEDKTRVEEETPPAAQ